MHSAHFFGNVDSVIEGEGEGGTGCRFHSSSGNVKRRSNDSISLMSVGIGGRALSRGIKSI